MVAKFCSRSHGQPPCGSRRRAMIDSRRSSSVLAALRWVGVSCALMRPPGSIGQPVAPRQAGVAKGNEIAVQQGFAAVVAEGLAGRCRQYRTARGVQHALAGGGIPFGGRAEPRVDVQAAFGDPAELQRRALGNGLDAAHAGQQRLGLR
ncbi:hypothetical protein G6F46_013906 [Rhizopus delemar]|nr:hypothetical protein G6F46_013906 [Rhizopus delemar]